jgi:hypothetical protein
MNASGNELGTLATADGTPNVRRRLAPRRFTMGLLGGICAFAGMILANGYGWPTLFFFLVGILLGSLGAGVVVRNAHSWMSRMLRRSALLAAVFLVSMGLARFSVRINLTMAFHKALGLDVPSGVSELRAWQQYSDGQIHVISFSASEQVIQSILSASGYKYEQENYDAQWLRDAGPQEFPNRLSTVIVAPLFSFDRLNVTQLSQPQVWRSIWKEKGSDEAIVLIWDRHTQQAIVSRL